MCFEGEPRGNFSDYMGERSKAFRKAGNVMKNEEIIQYYDDLMRLADAKCDSHADAEDLVGESMLAAFAYLSKGGKIEHPRTWLKNTFFHKYHDSLRKKYRTPYTELGTQYVNSIKEKIRNESTNS